MDKGAAPVTFCENQMDQHARKKALQKKKRRHVLVEGSSGNARPRKKKKHTEISTVKNTQTKQRKQKRKYNTRKAKLQENYNQKRLTQSHSTGCCVGEIDFGSPSPSDLLLQEASNV
ncbi:Hypothetical protein, putative [Bodo saltans]|uniref:Uncharacterized protein n=1 Tax=Bodo saltans TaxID=75058 RepID=A0A0S4JRF9_BODSA|nr:Hypothetical protein, putative [Bodo saltans]|eukprot:CUG94101.1 Hypothetical protein, putative [Bodo saltans]